MRSSLGLGNTQLVSRTYVYSHQAVRVHRLEDQPYLFNIYLVWTNDILPLNFTLLTCVMGILPRRVGKLCERTPGDMCHKMLSMQTYYKELGEHTPFNFQASSLLSLPASTQIGPWKKCIGPKDNNKMRFSGMRGKENKAFKLQVRNLPLLFLPLYIIAYIGITY